jgi:hypothetical protein
MKQLTVQDKKTIEKYKKKVHKQYPGAYLITMSNGWYTIMQEQENLTQKDVLAELCFTPQKDPIKAWELAQLTAKTTQNLNRTHPLRIEGMNMEDKIARVEARRLKKESALELRKKRESDIY